MLTKIIDLWYDYLDWYDENRKKTWFIGIFLVILIFFIFYMNNDKNMSSGNKGFLEENLYVPEPPVEEPTLELEEEILKEVETPDIVTSQLESDDNSVSFLLLGVDSRNKDFIGRTDSMILLTANKKEKSVKLVSIPRDSYVWIEKKGFRDKITHANAFGGQETAVDTVEDLFGIKIDHAVTINFESFVEVVDILGGIEVEVPFDFTAPTLDGKTISYYKGAQTLDGQESLAYARMRKQDPSGDIGRGERQQQIIESILKETATFSSVTNFKDLYNVAKDNVKTDVGLMDILNLVPHIQSVGDIEKLNLTGNGKKINGIYYYQLDINVLENVRKELKEHLGEEQKEEMVEVESTDKSTIANNQ